MNEMRDDRNRYDDDAMLPERGTPLEGRPTAGAPRVSRVMTHNANRRSRMGWLIPLALLALVAFGLTRLFGGRDRDDQVAANGATTTSMSSGGEVAGDTTAGAAAGASTVSLGTLTIDPTVYANKTVTVQGNVAQVVSDRGFWLESEGQRMFVVLGEKGAGTDAAEHAVDVKSGQSVTVTGHVFTEASQVPGGKLEAKTQNAIKGQKAFLHVLPQDVKQQS